MIPLYPYFSDISMELRRELHPLFKGLKEGISEFTFADIYIFRDAHRYKISKLGEGIFLIAGIDREGEFFMLPFGLPEKKVLDGLFQKYQSMKCVSEGQVERLTEAGYKVAEDRDNFDYLYLREDLVQLHGDKYHKKRGLIKTFTGNFSHAGRPLIDENKADAMEALDMWRRERGIEGDYLAALEALERFEELQLCGGVYYVNNRPAAYVLGEEIALGEIFVVHFEKALSKYKGLYQYVNQAFASILPERYRTINREQDLGDEGLRQAKITYRPVGFVKKFRASISA